MLFERSSIDPARRHRRALAVLSLSGALAAGVACGPRLSGPAGSGAASARRYVVDHRDELQREISVGSGRAIYGLATVAGCQDSAELGRVLNKKYAELFPLPSPSDESVAGAVVRVMSGDPAARCVDLLRGGTRPFGPGRYEVLGQRRGAGPVLREAGIRRLDPPDR